MEPGKRVYHVNWLTVISLLWKLSTVWEKLFSVIVTQYIHVEMWFDILILIIYLFPLITSEVMTSKVLMSMVTLGTTFCSQLFYSLSLLMSPTVSMDHTVPVGLIRREIRHKKVVSKKLWLLNYSLKYHPTLS